MLMGAPLAIQCRVPMGASGKKKRAIESERKRLEASKTWQSNPYDPNPQPERVQRACTEPIEFDCPAPHPMYGRAQRFLSTPPCL